MVSSSIKGFRNYSVSRDGLIVVNLKTGNVLTQWTNPAGYKTVGVKSDAGKWSTQLVHRLVFSQYYELDMFWIPAINHLDGKTINNSLENLEICTRQQNSSLPRHTVKERELPRGVTLWKIGKKKFRVVIKHLGTFKSAYFLHLVDAVAYYEKTFTGHYGFSPYASEKKISVTK